MIDRFLFSSQDILPTSVLAQTIVFSIALGLGLAGFFLFHIAHVKRKSTHLRFLASFALSVVLASVFFIVSPLFANKLGENGVLYVGSALLLMEMYSFLVMNVLNVYVVYFNRLKIRTVYQSAIPLLLLSILCGTCPDLAPYILSYLLCVVVVTAAALYYFAIYKRRIKTIWRARTVNAVMAVAFVSSLACLFNNMLVIVSIEAGFAAVLVIVIAEHVWKSENALYCPMSLDGALTEFPFVHKISEDSACARVNDQKEELARIIEQLHETNKLLTIERNINESQKNLYEKQSLDLKASIRYAQRIQKTMLKGENVIRQGFDDYFILENPRDIVSGDFYWSACKDGKIYVAVADCTGHGVPGAFLSIIGITYLNSILSNSSKTSPADILYELRERLITSFSTEGVDQEDVPRDGMDISLVSVDKSSMILEFAGAFNPIYLIRSNTLAPIKGDKIPISILAQQTAVFNNHTVNLENGDAIYMFTDGMADQFGSKTGKKFKYNQMKELFLEISELPFEAQKLIIQRIINSWRGDLDQVDDILILGLKI